MQLFHSRNALSLALSGILVMYNSHAFGVVFGASARLGVLFVGFVLVLLGALLRARAQVFNHSLLLMVLGLYAFLLSWNSSQLNHHSFFNSLLVQVFKYIAVLLYFSGYILARYRPQYGSNHPPIFPAVAVLTLVMSALAVTKITSITINPSNLRNVGDDANPIGVAYNYTILCLTSFVVAAYARGFFLRAVSLAAALVTLFIVLLTGSRGPLIWGGLSSILLIVINISSVKAALNRKLLVLIFLSVFLVLALPVIAEYVARSSVFGPRVANLTGRMLAVFDFLSGHRDMDRALAGRFDVVSMYLESTSDWILRGYEGYRDNPHNFLLEIFVRFGVVLGLPMFVMLILALQVPSALIASRRSYRLPFEVNAIMILFVFAFFQSLSSLYIEINRVFWFGAGYMIGLRHPLRPVDPTRHIFPGLQQTTQTR